MIDDKQCVHYSRSCYKQAPCCKIFYPCRLCHDEQFGIADCKVEIMDRYNITLIRCQKCLTEQPPSNQCLNCHSIFAKYYCDICKLWDDVDNRDIYHCDQCKMCRRGKKEESYHCVTCDICLNVLIKDKHQCMDKAFEQCCPICLEYLKTSRKYIRQLDNCKHWIHVKCFKELIQTQTKCPICNTSLMKMNQEQINQLDQIMQAAILQFPDGMFEDRKVDIICQECHKISKQVQYYPFMKCLHCGTYNTNQ